MSKRSSRSKHARPRPRRLPLPIRLGLLGLMLASLGATALTFEQQLEQTALGAALYSPDWFRALITVSILNLIAVFGLLVGANRLLSSLRMRDIAGVLARLAILAAALLCVAHNVSVTAARNVSTLAEDAGRYRAAQSELRRLQKSYETQNSALADVQARLTELRGRETALLSRPEYRGREPADYSRKAALIAALRALPGFSRRTGDPIADNPRDAAALRAETRDHLVLQEMRAEMNALAERAEQLIAEIAELSGAIGPLDSIDPEQSEDEALRMGERQALERAENLALQLFGYFGLLLVALIRGQAHRRLEGSIAKPGRPYLLISRCGEARVLVFDDAGDIVRTAPATLPKTMPGQLFAEVRRESSGVQDQAA